MTDPGAAAAKAERADHADWVRAAARNNAEWCDAVCRAHGLRGDFGDGAWASPHRTPPLYPDAVTLTDRLGTSADAAADLLARINTASPGCSVKDSFARLDLAPAGFEVLFEAQWIHRPAPAPTTAPAFLGSLAHPLEWDVLTEPADLSAWAVAWGAEPGDCGPFRPELLADDATHFLRARPADTDTGTGTGTGTDTGTGTGTNILAGAVATLSGGELVGLSNVFTTPEAATAGIGPQDTWAGCVSAVTARWPGLPVVGYESGADLEAAVANGFRAVGPLRVWWRTVRPDADHAGTGAAEGA
ncbi:hypothetical protein [Streptomyces paromomycinus]|uniref:Uncharacterized protein n=1 Tax=Streptomyces paromomycinus TaxID=92743 RepID=A0A401WCU5_STREY|nr:hypothetical protein [Streptomyces paromomycinus]GCD47111.1 hypothetical protein GKJPGBOP_06868 [Streptomyces paromomycinus]